MADYGEWNRKGATLSELTAKKEYGVEHEFIVKGIRAGKLEYQEGAIWGNPYLKILRGQLEDFITEELGADYLNQVRTKSELLAIKKEIAVLKKRVNELQVRKALIESGNEKMQ